MHSKVHIYRVTCPDCGTIQYGFVGDNEDGRFYCNAIVEIKKGNKIRKEECGYDCEKIRHLPEGSYEMIRTIKIEAFGVSNDTKS